MRVLYQPGDSASATAIDSSAYMLEGDWEGLSGHPLEVHATPTLYAEGVSLLGITKQPRTFTIPFSVFGTDHTTVSENLRALQALLNPFRGVGILYFETDRSVVVNNVTYKQTFFCRCICQEIEAPAGDARTFGGDAFQRIDATFYAPDPTWYLVSPPAGYVSLETYAYSATTLPVTLPLIPPLPTGVISATNSGQIATPMTMIITGRSSNPVIWNTTTGQRLRINWTLGPNQQFEIATVPGGLYVYLVDYTLPDSPAYYNALPVVDQASAFPQLASGANTLVYQDDGVGASEADRPKLTVRYFHRYLGL